ncbi:hypothetical protein RSOLAG22IIIB_10583 [Rhizoctonia solani]|uniref:Uncharacterized protein n=1 Tax=Rhizoctonia solani TaxID=456999 RepID=A0A0K6G433_9AGAM|nr:hypothetical protein RSOLAG22IIIB_10583 [Rhizoctonia solani]
MPKKLVCVFGSDFYNDHADSRLLNEYMVRNGTDQSTHFVQTKTPLLDEPAPAKATGIKGRFQRKRSVTNKAPTLPPYTQAVSDAYTFLNEQYQPDVEIILFAVTGTSHDWPVLRAATRVLAEHLEAGTVPPRLAQDTASTVDRERDEFGDRPLKEPPSNILGKKIESSVAIVYRSTSPITEINNALLEEFPLSVKSIFSFNWAVGHENYCHTFRDEAGQITSREVGYFKNIQWHIPVVINSTMNFIHYKPKETDAWRTIKRVTPRTLTSLPTPLIPECPPSPITTSPPPPRKSRFTLRFGSKQKSESRSSTLPSIRSTQRSSTLMSGYTTTRRSDTLMSGYSTNSFGPRVSSPPPTIPNSASSFTSTSTSDMTRSPRTSTVLTESSCASNDSSGPSLREAYISLPGMTKHQVWAYPAFLTTRDNYALPERVIWRSSRE